MEAPLIKAICLLTFELSRSMSDSPYNKLPLAAAAFKRFALVDPNPAAKLVYDEVARDLVRRFFENDKVAKSKLLLLAGICQDPVQLQEAVSTDELTFEYEKDPAGAFRYGYIKFISTEHLRTLPENVTLLMPLVAEASGSLTVAPDDDPFKTPTKRAPVKVPGAPRGPRPGARRARAPRQLPLVLPESPKTPPRAPQ